jgi:ribose-phosphate pyrophosphokinase
MLQPPKLFCGSSNTALGHKIAASIGIEVADADVKRFSDGEVDVRINESVRAHDVFILQSICYPGNDHLMELLLMIDACRRASAGRVNAVIPYFGYSRQDRVTHQRVPISAKVVANTLRAVGVDRVITMDIHAEQIQGFFDIPVDHLRAGRRLVEHLRSMEIPDPLVVAPDSGGVDRASRFAGGLGAMMALIDRRRGAPSKAKSMHLIGDVTGRECILVDDMIDTGSTITEAADLLMTSGAKSVRAVVTHPVLSGSGVERLNRSKIAQLIATDTVPLPVEKQIDKIAVVSVAEQLAKVIENVHHGRSVKGLG